MSTFVKKTLTPMVEVIYARLKLAFYIYEIRIGEGHAFCFGRLMSRDYIEPTSAMDVIVEEGFRPFFNRLNTIVRRLLGDDIGEDKVFLCSMSILGQCLYFGNSRPVISRLLRKDHCSVGEINETVVHIACFSLEAHAG